MNSSGDFVAAADRGVTWIVEHQRADGSFCDQQDGIGSYCKVPYALSLRGRLREATLLADWVGEHHATPNGDFRAPESQTQEPFQESSVYENAWLVQAMHRVSRWDLSLPGAEFLMKFQVPAGGFYAHENEYRFLEPVCTAWGGLAALTTGHLESAKRAGDVLARMVFDQPDPRRFYFRMEIEGQLITDVPAGVALRYFVDAGHPEQQYYNPGIALVFLTHLYRATHEERYLKASKEIFNFTERCAEDVYRFPASGKLGLGCALLYTITGGAEARRAAVQVAQYLVESQSTEGFWRLPDLGSYAAINDRDSFDLLLDITAEFSTFLTEIAART